MDHTTATDTAGTPAGALTILVVDDDDAVRRALTRMLQHVGFRTIEARDGSEAIHRFSEHAGEISAVTLDLAMPTTSGYETFAMLTEYDPGLPVVIATAFPADDMLRRWTSAPGRGFLQKPFTTKALQDELHRVIAEMPRGGQ